MNIEKKIVCKKKLFFLKNYMQIISNIIELDGETYLQVGQNYTFKLDLKHG